MEAFTYLFFTSVNTDSFDGMDSLLEIYFANL